MAARPSRLLVLAVVILTLTTILGAVGSGIYYRKYQKLKLDPQAEVDAQNAQLLTEVGQLMVLPDEVPTIATVTDPDQLTGQEFFGEAKVGDRVLIYTEAQKAVLYDPVAKKILEVAPVNMGLGGADNPLDNNPDLEVGDEALDIDVSDLNE